MHQLRRSAPAVVLAAGLLLAGCADDDDDGTLAVGDTGPEATPVDTAAVDTVPGDTVPVDTVPVDTVPVDTGATEATAVDDTAATTSADTTGVSFAPATDEESIRFAYETWILFDTPADVRAALIEGGDEQAAAIQAGFEEHESIIWDASIAVDAVTLLDADHAEVVFRVLWGGDPSPYFPDPLTGTAVRTGDHWRISRETLCALFAGSIGGQCATTGAPPQPGTTIVVDSTPIPVTTGSPIDTSANTWVQIGIVPTTAP